MKSVQRLSAVVAGLIMAWALAAAEGFAGEPVESVPVWQRWERSFQADADPNTELVATLTSPSGKRRRVRGFFDGGNARRVRFMPDEPGPWRFQTTSQPRRAGLAVRSSVLIASEQPATRLTTFLKKSQAVTIEAWVAPANLQQAGPARIVTFSRDTGSRNFTLGQKGPACEVRLRTTKTSPNGEPAVSSPGVGSAGRHVAAARSPEGDLAVAYLPVGGTVAAKTQKLRSGWKAQWFDPRTGKYSPARSSAGGTFRSPDEKDWVLVFRAGK